MTNTCTTHQTGNQICTTCTGQPYIPPTAGVPPSLVPVPVLAWDAGAVTATPDGGDKVLTGDLYIEFDAARCGGVMLGFADPGRVDVTDPTTIRFAWHVKTVNGALVAQPVESGQLRGSAQAVSVGARLRVQRVGGQVTYRIGAATVYTSGARSVGGVLGAVALFANGDSV